MAGDGVGLAAGVVVFGAVVVLPAAGVAADFGGLLVVDGVAEAPVPVPEAGVVGVDAGSVVSGVGSGGNGLESTLAIISFKPSVVWL